MGQRGAKAVFMPDKFVFPGGRVDDADGDVRPIVPLDPAVRAQLLVDADEHMPEALAVAAIRELWEETGLILGADGHRDHPEDGAARGDWADFFRSGVVPACNALSYFFRAVTPPGRPRRFDARFFIAEAAAVHGAASGALDDFANASGELQHLQWIALSKARQLPMPFVTELVLAEVQEIVATPTRPRPIPYMRHGATGIHVDAIR